MHNFNNKNGRNSTYPAVAIVDPDVYIQNRIKYLLEILHLDADTYVNAEEFLCELMHTEYGCLITDTSLPGISGIELLKQLCKQNQHLPIIFVSSQPNVALAVQALQLGATDFLEKPFIEPMLIHSVMEILQSNAHGFGPSSTPAPFP